ncbi:MAG: hypothetical protein HZB79_01880 [Deltaproteobacteria bacterium]|nr:hypothetical protein [Deltaproteobacteria bacterium]
MKQTTAENTVNMLHKIELIEKEIGDLKLSILKNIAPPVKKIISLKGIIKSSEITEKDIAAAKKSLYSKVEI